MTEIRRKITTRADDDELVQAFARHRLAAITPAPAESVDRVRSLIAELEALPPDLLEVVRYSPEAKQLLALLPSPPGDVE